MSQMKKILDVRDSDQYAMSVRNPLLRTLCIAAFLRCIFGSIESPPDIEFHKEAVRKLAEKDVFKNLT